MADNTIDIADSGLEQQDKVESRLVQSRRKLYIYQNKVTKCNPYSRSTIYLKA